MEVSKSEELENECGPLVGNSMSLFNTGSILLWILCTVEEFMAHSVSDKDSNSKTVGKPKFDGEKLKLLRKLALEMHNEATSFQITAKKKNTSCSKFLAVIIDRIDQGKMNIPHDINMSKVQMCRNNND